MSGLKRPSLSRARNRADLLELVRSETAATGYEGVFEKHRGTARPFVAQIEYAGAGGSGARSLGSFATVEDAALAVAHEVRKRQAREASVAAAAASPHLAAPLRPLGAPSSRPSPVSGSDSARPDGMEWSPPWTATEDDQLREAMQLGRIDIYDGEELHFDVPGLAGWRDGGEIGAYVTTMREYMASEYETRRADDEIVARIRRLREAYGDSTDAFQRFKKDASRDAYAERAAPRPAAGGATPYSATSRPHAPPSGAPKSAPAPPASAPAAASAAAAAKKRRRDEQQTTMPPPPPPSAPRPPRRRRRPPSAPSRGSMCPAAAQRRRSRRWSP